VSVRVRDRSTRKMPVRMTAGELMAAYEGGERYFADVVLDGEQLVRVNLHDACFLKASFKKANLEGADLTGVQLKMADLSGARLIAADLGCTDLIWAKFRKADLTDADLTGAALQDADCTGAILKSTYLGNASLTSSVFADAMLDGAKLFHTDLSEVDVSPFCDTAKLKHSGPSTIDARTVMKSYRNRRLKSFMLDCGVPPLFATYMIDCAIALGEPLLRSLMQSTFISYGSPDEAFARKLYEALKHHGVVVFFFPETAALGERIDSEVYRRLQEHDRVILICSRASLDRPGVLNEIRETFDREARDGAATYLLPIMLDDYVLTGWRGTHPDLAERVSGRVVGDFRKAARSRKGFEQALDRLLDALKRSRPDSFIEPEK
jgi:hypothetical protein